MVPRAEEIAAGCGVVACDTEDPWHVFGWLAYGRLAGAGDVCRYVYVKHAYRRMGLARAMWGAAFGAGRGHVVTCEHVGRVYGHLRERYALAFDPHVWRNV
jgi:GNAT superfamily N-acetyltransferase